MPQNVLFGFVVVTMVEA